MKTMLTVMTLVLALAAVAVGEEVLLNDGGAIEGEVVSADKTGVTVKHGEKSTLVGPDELDPHYYYTQWSKRITKGDAQAHLDIAVYAFENGLFNQARSQYRKAQRIDKELTKKFEEEVIPELKEGVAAQLLDKARKAIDDGDYKTAEKIVAKILTRLENTRAAAQAREVLASVHLWELNKDQEKLVKHLARYLPKDEEKALKSREKVAAKLGPIEKRIDRARGKVTKGLRTKTSNRQKGVFQSAAKDFESAIKMIDKAIAEAGDDQAFVEYANELRSIAVREAIDAYVHAGGVLMVRSSFNDALEMANKALALDPDSAAAKKFYQETLRASQTGGWWGFGRGGRRR